MVDEYSPYATRTITNKFTNLDTLLWDILRTGTRCLINSPYIAYAFAPPHTGGKNPLNNGHPPRVNSISRNHATKQLTTALCT